MRHSFEEGGNGQEQTETSLWLVAQTIGHGRRWIGISIAFGLGQGVLMVMQAWLLATLLHGFIIEGSTPEHSAPLHQSVAGDPDQGGPGLWPRGGEFQGGQCGAPGHPRAGAHPPRQARPCLYPASPAGSWASLLLEQIEEMQDFFSRYLPQMAIAVFIPW